MLAALPYADLAGSRDPVELLPSTPEEIAHLVRNWEPGRWVETYAPGKWSAAQLILHLAQDEIGWSNRIRLALTTDNYVVQTYDAGEWVVREAPTEHETALSAFLALRKLNLILYRRMPEGARARRFSHGEFGEISIDWILKTLAGHDLHHLRQLRVIADTENQGIPRAKES